MTDTVISLGLVMERNGLAHREREKKIGRWILGVCGFIFLSFFLAPLTLEPGTVSNVEGRANAFDFYDEEGWGSSGNEAITQNQDGDLVNEGYHWSEMNPYAAFAYAFGDLNCHQKSERSWELNGNQLPVCTRDLGIFAGMLFGGLMFTQRGWNRWTVRDTCLSVLPESMLQSTYKNNRRTLLWIGCGLLLCLPLIFDGFLQLLTSYESNNLKRILTGLPFGFGLGILMCGMFAARADAFVGAGEVLLPGDAKFVLASTPATQESE